MPHQKPLVSVVLPVYNAFAVLGEALDSVLGQTWGNLDVVVVDDGSTDGSLAAAQAYARTDERVRVAAQAHQGIVTALQRGCEAARGCFIARMDADDLAGPQRIARQVEHMDENPGQGLCGVQVRMFGPSAGKGRKRYERWINSLCEQDAIIRELFVECPIPHPAFLMRRRAYDDVGGYVDHGWPEDYDLVMRLWRRGYGLGKVADTLLSWRDTPGRLSMRDDRYSPYQFRRLKRHYLFQSYLEGKRPFVQWGAGEVGKTWLKEWPEDRRPSAVVDINPRKIGRFIHGLRVIAPDEMPAAGERFVIIAVGAPGARPEIREWLAFHGYREGEHYLFVA
ncbi:MAG: glycosyltransferase family 2 protein [Candidatus Hydrogenedentota bacterium]